jgi:hypothetical protein
MYAHNLMLFIFKGTVSQDARAQSRHPAVSLTPAVIRQIRISIKTRSVDDTANSRLSGVIGTTSLAQDFMVLSATTPLTRALVVLSVKTPTSQFAKLSNALVFLKRRSNQV